MSDVEDLDPVVASVCYIEQVAIDRNMARAVEVSGIGTGVACDADGRDPCSAAIENLYPIVAGVDSSNQGAPSLT